MAKISSRQELADWLEGKPKNVSVILAVRAALQVVPVFRYFDPRGGIKHLRTPADKVVLAAFRALAITWGSVGGHNRTVAARATSSSAFAASASASAAINIASNVRFAPAATPADLGKVYSVARAASASAFAASAANTSASHASAADASASAADASAFAASDASVDAAVLWKSISDDVSKIEDEKISVIDVLSRPLELADLSTDWNVLSAQLEDRPENWSFWIDWYQDRLDGRPLSAAFEKALLTLTDDEWEGDVGQVNAQLASLKRQFEEEVRKKKPETKAEQRPALSLFDTRNHKYTASNYPIALEEHTLVEGVYDAVKKQLSDYLQELRDYEHPDTNSVANTVSHMLDCLGGSLGDVDHSGLMIHLTMFEYADDQLSSATLQGGLPERFGKKVPPLLKALDQFRGFYSDDLKIIEERGLALGIKIADFDEVEKFLTSIIQKARESGLFDQSGIDALQSGSKEKTELIQRIAALTSEQVDLRTDLEVAVSKIQALEVNNARNMAEVVAEQAQKERRGGILKPVGDAIVRGVTKPIEKATEYTIIVGSAYLAQQLGVDFEEIVKHIEHLIPTTKKLQDISPDADDIDPPMTA